MAEPTGPASAEATGPTEASGSTQPSGPTSTEPTGPASAGPHSRRDATARGSGEPPAAGVLVIGSANADLVTVVDRRPGAGETVLGADLAVQPGGKGANQAVAAARLGARVRFAGCVGRDGHGDLLLVSLVSAGVDVSAVRRPDDAPTGVALITVTPDGDNAIIVCPGANARFTTADADRALAGPSPGTRDTGTRDTGTRDTGTRDTGTRDTGTRDTRDVVVLQLELPQAVVEHAALSAAGAGSRVVLNLAPAAPLPRRVLAVCDPLVLNEHEAAQLLGLTAPATGDDVSRLLELGPRSVVLTLGAAGAVAGSPEERISHVPAPAVTPVDTTGAGDALTGALAWRLAEGDGLLEAVRFAVRVGSTATLRPGAQPSFPRLDDVLGPPAD